MFATATTALPAHRGGSTSDRNPSNGCFSATPCTQTQTPLGSGMLKLWYGPATGLRLPITMGYLSHQPAQLTVRSIDALTSASAFFPETPVVVRMASARSARRPSSISASR